MFADRHSYLRRAAETDPTLVGGSPRILQHAWSRSGRGPSGWPLPRAVDRLLDVLHSLPVQAEGLRHLGRSWKALAAEIGLTHEATYRALARLERAGVLQREGRGAIRLATGPMAA